MKQSDGKYFFILIDSIHLINTSVQQCDAAREQGVNACQELKSVTREDDAKESLN